MQVYFTVNGRRTFSDSSWCPVNRGCPFNMGSANYYRFHCSFKYGTAKLAVNLVFDRYSVP